MDCYHPYCPMSHLSHRPHPWNWNNVVSLPEAAIKPLLRPTISAALTPFGPLTTTPMPRPNIPGGKAALDRILELCPCLYTQIQETVSARGIVHLCEITLGTRINSSNVEQAFQIQHPSISTVHFLFPPATPGAGGGATQQTATSPPAPQSTWRSGAMRSMPSAASTRTSARARTSTSPGDSPSTGIASGGSPMRWSSTSGETCAASSAEPSCTASAGHASIASTPTA